MWGSFHGEAAARALDAAQREKLGQQLLAHSDANHNGAMEFGEFENWYRAAMDATAA